MRSLRWRTAVWFALSVIAVLGVFLIITHAHLTHELRIERWERTQKKRTDWVLHGSFSDAEVNDITGELWRLSLLYAFPVSLLALGMGYLLARRSLQPIADLDQQLARISARSLNQRIQLANADRELKPIETNVNDLLARLDTAFAQLSEYSAQVAHELRTPLTLLRLKIEGAADRIEPELAESIQDELARLSDYVDQCLLLATAEQGRLQLAREPVALDVLLEEMLETYRLWAGQEGRALILKKEGEQVITGDPGYLRQIFHNLLTNAIRHGTGPIHISLATDQQGPVCSIENTALPSTRDVHGSGIGLRIARALSHALGCSLVVKESAGRFSAELRWSRDRP
ncbi:hypothetical protein MASR2M8_14630 [Opitutaceae bacterium]